MAYEPPQEMPEDLDKLDEICAIIHQKGVELGKASLRKDIKDFLLKEFFGAKGRERRANENDPKVQAIRAIMERLYAAFEDGTL
jgi:hypothetical protein